MTANIAATLRKSQKSQILKFLGSAEEVWLAGIVYGGEPGIILKGIHCVRTFYGEDLNIERAERIIRGLEIEEDWIEVRLNQRSARGDATQAQFDALALLNEHVLSIRTFGDFDKSLSASCVPFAAEIFLRVWAQIGGRTALLLEHIAKAPKLGVAVFCRNLLKVDENGLTLAEACNVNDSIILEVASKCVGLKGAIPDEGEGQTRKIGRIEL